jgi:hypothetical protein
VSEESDERKARMTETVRLVITRRERAPRSPRMERAFKRLIWRYTLRDDLPEARDKGKTDVQE